MFLIHNDVKIMKISKQFKGVNFGFFCSTFFQFLYCTTSTNRCILPISFSSVGLFLTYI
jgi:hypothetical protein